MRRASFLTIFLTGFILVSGCSTAYHTARGFGRGIAEDVKDAWQAAVKADEWFDKHTW